MDREKVIKALECCLKESDHLYSNPCNGCPYEGQECIDRMKADALALLKDQQQQIWELQDKVEYLTDKLKEQKFLVESDGKITPLPVVVLCKDCKHYHKGFNCDLLQKPIMKGDDWFCADGESK